MLTSFIFLVIGLVVLLAAGDMLVRGAAGLARIANISPLVIGLTVVAFGTSAPELVVTIQAVAGGVAGIAMGNIVGSNIANILLVLGLPAIISPIALGVPRLRRHGIALLLGTALFSALVYRRGGIGLPEALAFTGGMLAYFAMMWNEARHGRAAMAEEAKELTSGHPRLSKTLLFLIAGLIGLPVGASLLVTHGETLARLLGVRDEIIGLTVVAFGTSLPELATVIAAAIKRHSSMVAGSIIGSNVFNMLFVGAAAGFVDFSPVTDAALRLDFPVMIAATLLIGSLIVARGTIGRVLGILMTGSYIAYIALLGAMGLA